jgi:hypothetical protein
MRLESHLQDCHCNASTRASQVAFPTAHRPPPATRRRPLVEYKDPMEKARTSVTTPMGSLFDPGILIRPFSHNAPFKFPFPTPSPHPTTQLHNRITASGGLLGSVTHVVGLPRVFGLHGDEKSIAKIIHTAIASNTLITHSSWTAVPISASLAFSPYWLT